MQDIALKFVQRRTQIRVAMHFFSPQMEFGAEVPGEGARSVELGGELAKMPCPTLLNGHGKHS